MKKGRKRYFAGLVAMAGMVSGCAAPEPEPYGALPTEAQVAWQRMEMNMFCHFGPNTYSGAEWGDGKEEEDLFAPEGLDCRQWVEVAAEAGMGGIIVTAKHHDGFCLWPSGQSSHSVGQSRWRDGKGDVLRELRMAIDEHNAVSTKRVEMGVYVSPWDRNHAAYGTAEYNDVFDATLREVHGEYGPMFEQWFDGACGEGPNGKRQKYDWPRFMETVREMNPEAIVFSDIGPGCRWVGNEEGHTGDPCWSTLRTEGATPSENKPMPSELEHGHCGADRWVPAEVDVSIRPGWFWHAGEEAKSVEELVDIYCASVGRNGLLLLNVPPDTSGRICAADSVRLMEFRKEIDRMFEEDMVKDAHLEGKHRRGQRYAARQVADSAYDRYWAARENEATLTIEWDEVREMDMIVVQEYIPLGQRVSKMWAEVDDGTSCRALGSREKPLCSTVGYRRIVRIDREMAGEQRGSVRAKRLTLHFEALAPALINRISIYNTKKR